MATPVLGAGLCPAGSSAAGFGSPAIADENGNTVLPLANGGTGTGRYIDPQTRDYVATADGNLQGLGSAAQDVWLTLAAFSGGPRMLNESSIAKYEIDIRAALAPLVARGLITLRSIVIARAADTPTRLSTAIRWIDTSSGQELTTSIV
jgi:hypothetical protein